MRFAAAQKLTVYLAAGTALAATLLSGELDPLTLVLGVGVTIGSWWLEPPRFRMERATAVFTVLALVAMALAILTALTGEILLGGTRFIVHLLLIKLCTRRTTRDVQQVILLSVLLIAAATAVNTGPSFAFFFALFVVSMTWALILFHLRREMEDNFLLKHGAAQNRSAELERVLGSRRVVGRSFFVATGAVSLAILSGAVVFFLAFPRIGFGLFFQKQRSGISVAGFSERVELGGHGTIRDDETVVMRVVVDDPRFRGEAAGALHWRGVAFDTYQDGRWSRMDTRTSRSNRTFHGNRETTLDLDFGGKGPATGRALRQEIYLEPLDSDVLFGASVPDRFTVPEIGAGSRARSVRETADQVVRIDHTAGIRYVVESFPDDPADAALAAAAAPDLARFKTDLALPADLPPRVAALARQIVGNATTTLEKVRRIDAHLRENYTYTLEMKTDEAFEPLDYFLFERKAGHCEYFATAMAVLLRAVDVPTRNVNGFLGGEWNDYGGYIAVRSGDAHSWVEVWFEGVGWVTWDPTPAGAVGTEEGFLASLGRMLDTLRLSYFKWVLEYDLSRQLSLFRDLGDALGLSGGSKFSTKKLSAWAKQYRVTIVLLLVIVVAIVAIVIWWRRRKQRGQDGARHPGKRSALLQLYDRTANRLARAGFGRAPGQTPREHAARLTAQAAPGAAAFTTLTELYYDARFGELDVPIAQAAPLAEAIRDALADAKRKKPGVA